MRRSHFFFSALVLATSFGCNATPSGVDSGAGGNDTGASSGDVAACQAAVDAVISACQAEGGNTARECIYANYRTACATGRTAVVTAMMNCLRMDACQTLSDPSAAGACVSGVVSANLTPAHQALGAAICGCDGTQTGCPAYPQYSGAELVVVSEADAHTVTTCLTATGACTDANACYRMVPYGTAFLACTGP